MLARVLAATVAGGIAFFILGFLIFGLLLDPIVIKPNMNTYPGLVNETPVFLRSYCQTLFLHCFWPTYSINGQASALSSAVCRAVGQSGF